MIFTPYKNINVLSPVDAYAFGKDWISVRFINGDIQTYRYCDSGWLNVRRMIRYAKSGKNLASFIMKNKRLFKTEREL